MKRRLLILAAIILFLGILAAKAFLLVQAENSKSKLPPPAEPGISQTAISQAADARVYVGPSEYLRDFPLPYSAMLAINSDIDGTTLESFQRYHYFLNTPYWNEETGCYGLDLDVADSFWIYGGESAEAFSGFAGYDRTDDIGMNEIAWYYSLGYIDSLHSFGDFSGADSPDRSYAESAWETMDKWGVSVPIFVNHGDKANKLNFGGYSSFGLMRYQQGDNPESPYYHTDLSLSHGIRYVWASRGSSRYIMENPLYLIRLRDGQKVWGYQRFTHVQKGLKKDWLWTPARLYEELSEARLSELAAQGGFAIVGQHLGSENILSYEQNVSALRRLKEYQEEGRILVARTSRLLDYAVARSYVRYSVSPEGVVNILEVADPVTGSRAPRQEELSGLCFRLPGCREGRLLVQGVPLEEAVAKTDETGCLCLQIPWYGEEETHAQDQQ